MIVLDPTFGDTIVSTGMGTSKPVSQLSASRASASRASASRASANRASANRALLNLHSQGPYLLIWIFYSTAIIISFPYLLSSTAFPSEDLPAHVSLIERFRAQLLQGQLVFYDSALFTGWPAFQFYGFLGHATVALSSFLFEPFADSPVQLATNLWIAAVLLMLPLSLRFCGSAFIRDDLLQPRLAHSLKLLHFLFCCVLAFWFLSSDEQYFGMGAGAAVFIGLLSQVMAWHLVLWYAGHCLRLATERSTSVRPIALCIAVLICTHTLSAVYAVLFAAVCFAILPRTRLALLTANAIGVALAGFWVIPFVALSGQYVLPDPYPASGDLLRMLFRYPLAAVIQAGSQSIAHLLTQLNFGYLLVACLIVTVFTAPEAYRAKLVRPFLFALLILSLCLSSDFVASAIPLGLHYYRFDSLSILLLLGLLSVVPTLSVIRRNNAERSITISRKLAIFWVCFALIASGTAWRLAPFEQAAAKEELAKNSTVWITRIADALNASPAQGRVYIEHLNDYKQFPYLSAQFLAARLHALTGRETINGLFVESSLSHRIASVSASLLGAEVFSPYLIFSKGSDLGSDLHIALLRSMGVTDVVAGSKAFIDKLAPYAAEPPKQIGAHSIVRLAPTALPLVEPVTRPIVGYYDLAGSLPFYLLDFYFSARASLFDRMTLVELTRDSLQKLSAEHTLSAILVHTGGRPIPEWLRSAVRSPTLTFDSPTALAFTHYQREYAPQQSIRRYRELEAFFDGTYQLPTKLTAVIQAKPRVAPDSTFTWEPGGQSFVVTTSELGTALSINYSYFPLWYSTEGTILRGSQQRMILFPDAKRVRASFRRDHHGSFMLGLLVSLAGILGLLIGPRLVRRSTVDHANSRPA